MKQMNTMGDHLYLSFDKHNMQVMSLKYYDVLHLMYFGFIGNPVLF